MKTLLALSLAATTALSHPTTTTTIPYSIDNTTSNHTPLENASSYLVSLGPRPYYIINNMTASPLKSKLQSCENKPVSINSFSIGHRGGGTLQFPEETERSEDAGARMGAGILECDVSFTKDGGLVCRHGMCDLHTTTDILLRPELAAKCTRTFTPANATSEADALCCTSDITTEEFSTLCGKQDGYNASALTPSAYQYGTPPWRTELYDTCARVLTLGQYIDLVNSYPGYRNFTPELKTPPAAVPMPFNGTFTQAQYAQSLVDAFRTKAIAFERIWPQSFLFADIAYWIAAEPDFGAQAVFLQEYDTAADVEAGMRNLSLVRAAGVNIVSPSLPMLLSLAGPDNKTIVKSEYSKAVKAHGMDIVAWTLERSGPLATVKERGEYYFASIADVVSSDGQLYEVLDVLVREVGIKGLFSDWAATVTYFANCFGLEGLVGGSYA
ncbi:PLC-like phosphodiesterase [Stemphylium lycopersici]|nr:PLC-like phosphodiesterase [Stemphylium lycopersici]